MFNIILWVVQVLISAAFLMPGFFKLFTSYTSMIEAYPWMSQFTEPQITAIGAFELLGVIGLNLPFLLNRFKKLVPLAATGLAMTMIGAVTLHLNRGEGPEHYMYPLILCALALFVSIRRRNLLHESPPPEVLVNNL